MKMFSYITHIVNILDNKYLIIKNTKVLRNLAGSKENNAESKQNKAGSNTTCYYFLFGGFRVRRLEGGVSG